MSGSGNDFILIDHRHPLIHNDQMKEFARKVCQRRVSVGADGLIFIEPSEKADFKWRFFNADGSEAEMCGNGIRCLARYAFDMGYLAEKGTIQTLAGAVDVACEYDEDGDFLAEVTMTEPGFDAPSIPAKGSGDFHEIINGYEVYAVNTGVPHAVIFVKDIDSLDV